MTSTRSTAIAILAGRQSAAPIATLSSLRIWVLEELLVTGVAAVDALLHCLIVAWVGVGKARLHLIVAKVEASLELPSPILDVAAAHARNVAFAAFEHAVFADCLLVGSVERGKDAVVTRLIRILSFVLARLAGVGVHLRTSGVRAVVRWRAGPALRRGWG